MKNFLFFILCLYAIEIKPTEQGRPPAYNPNYTTTQTTVPLEVAFFATALPLQTTVFASSATHRHHHTTSLHTSGTNLCAKTKYPRTNKHQTETVYDTWNMQTGTPLASSHEGFPETVLPCKANNGPTSFSFIKGNHFIKKTDAHNEEQRILIGNNELLKELRNSPNHRHVDHSFGVFSKEIVVFPGHNGKMHWWNTSTGNYGGEIETSHPYRAYVHPDGTNTSIDRSPSFLTIHPKNANLIFSSHGSSASLYDREKNTEYVLSHHQEGTVLKKDQIIGFFDPQSPLLATHNKDEPFVRLWNTSNGTIVGQIGARTTDDALPEDTPYRNMENIGENTYLAFNPHKSQLLIVRNKNTHLLDPQALTAKKPITLKTNLEANPRFHKVVPLLIAPEKGKITIWKPDSGDLVYSISTTDVKALTLSQTTGHIAFEDGKQIRIIDLRDTRLKDFFSGQEKSEYPLTQERITFFKKLHSRLMAKPSLPFIVENNAQATQLNPTDATFHALPDTVKKSLLAAGFVLFRRR